MCPSLESEPRAGLGLPSFPSERFPHRPTLCYSRIGRKATILVQLLLFAIIGLTTAFMPSFELYMVLRFAVATAVAGYTFSNVSLRECMGPEALSLEVRSWGLSSPCAQTACGSLVGSPGHRWPHAKGSEVHVDGAASGEHQGGTVPGAGLPSTSLFAQLQSGWGPRGGRRPWSWPSAPSPWGRWCWQDSPMASETGGFSR